MILNIKILWCSTRCKKQFCLNIFSHSWTELILQAVLSQSFMQMQLKEILYGTIWKKPHQWPWNLREKKWFWKKKFSPLTSYLSTPFTSGEKYFSRRRNLKRHSSFSPHTKRIDHPVYHTSFRLISTLTYNRPCLVTMAMRSRNDSDLYSVQSAFHG